MEHRVTYVRFILTDENGGARLHPSKLIVHPLSGGNPVLVMDGEGNVTETGDIVLDMEESKGEYPGEIYVAILNENDAAVTYNFKAIVDGETYIGPLSTQSQYAPALGASKGTLRGAERMMRKTTPASALTITDIPDQTFTGYAIEPTLTVKDGETTLTLDTDYSVAFTNNVDVSEATATISGLADALARAETKYLGTKDKTFNIVQATPVIVLDDSQVTLTYGGSGNTRTVTRVFIDNNTNGTWDEGTDYDITDQCTVTYSSGTTSTATVDPSTGAVQPSGQGTTTITATVATAQNWTTATASYSVKVDNKADGTLSDYSDPDDSEWSD